MSHDHMRVDIEIEEEDKKRLERCFGRSVNVSTIAHTLAKAGALDAIDRATGRATPTTASEMRALYILSLFRAGLKFEDAEKWVASFFKVPISAARRQIEAAFARYDSELRKYTAESIQRILDNAERGAEEETWEIKVPSTLIQKWIKEQMGVSEYPDPRRARRGAVWVLPNETYGYLRLCARSEIESLS